MQPTSSYVPSEAIVPEQTTLRRVKRWLADALMPWTAANASVWPSQDATHQVLMDTRRREQSQARYLVGRLDDALRDVDPEYVESPLEMDEVRPFLGGDRA
jgi:hypothetical protein